jgi:pimeloyl-ACP methyl ester carboxylesterase
MKVIKCLIVLVLCSAYHPTWAQQILTVEKLQTFTVQDIEELVSAVGVPSGIVVPLTAVDYYKVTYLTPYLHPDSLVKASGAVAVPLASDCEFPLVGYGHGTQTKRANAASFMNGGQWELGVLLASTGYVVALPDYLGLGDADPRVPIHPYTHAYSQANTMINMLRSAREMTDSLGVELNGQVFLFGYSQGGGTTVATVREIEQLYPDEFNIAGAAPMSGAYDLKVAQVDLIASDSVYPTPGYLPYIVLAYQSIYGNLYEDVSQFLRSPYDTIIPPLFFEGNTSIGSINAQCPPVPKHIALDSTVNSFLSDTLHPLRLNLLDNDLIRGWYPTSPMKLIYCQGDDQVTYLNSENAFDSWTAAGAPQLQKQDLGDWDHQGCALIAILVARNYFDSIAVRCVLSVEEDLKHMQVRIAPNPADQSFVIETTGNVPFESADLLLIDVNGRIVLQLGDLRGHTINVERNGLPAGMYYYRISQQGRTLSSGKAVFQ